MTPITLAQFDRLIRRDAADVLIVCASANGGNPRGCLGCCHRKIGGIGRTRVGTEFGGRYIAIDIAIALASKDAARQALHAKMTELRSAGRTVFDGWRNGRVPMQFVIIEVLQPGVRLTCRPLLTTGGAFGGWPSACRTLTRLHVMHIWVL